MTRASVAGRSSQFLLMFVIVAFCYTPAAHGGPPPATGNTGSLGGLLGGHNVVTDTGEKAHLFLSTEAQKQAEAALATSALACVPGDLLYNGGPVMRNPTNYLIFWVPQAPPGGRARSAFPAGYQTAVELFFQDLSATPFYNIVTEYNDTSFLPVPDTESLGAPSFLDTTTVAPSGCDGTATGAVGATPTCPLTDGDIRNEVNVALAANRTWARPGQNVEYFVFTPSDAGECVGSQFCFAINGGVGPNEFAEFCAYHSVLAGGPYAFQPFSGNGNCNTNVAFPNGRNVDNVLNSTSHELIESNTDPFLDAWVDACGGESGDKCNFNFGFTTVDGTNIVLNGDRYQIQQEYSNDIHGCAKRFGDPPVISVPTSLDFGEVQGGTTTQQDVVIQNNGGGDLNILNVRLGGGSDPAYSLINVPPTSATVHNSESLTIQVQFAPALGAPFGHPTATLVVDTDAPAQTTYNTSINGTIATPIPSCSVSITSPVNGAVLHGTVNVSLVDQTGTCPIAFNRVYIDGRHYDGGQTIRVDTTQLPNGPEAIGAIGWDKTGLIKEATAAPVSVTVSN
jgi:hypothetical protein